MVLSVETLKGFPYLVAVSSIIVLAFVLFTKSIQERFLWLIALLPLSLYFKEVSSIYISAVDIASFLLSMEIVLKLKLFSFPREKESKLAICLLLAILISSLLSPLGELHQGIMMRAFITLFLFLFGIQIFNNYQQLMQILRTLSTLLVTFFLVYFSLLDYDAGYSFNSFINEYILQARSKNLIGIMAISMPCYLIFPNLRRWTILIMLFSLFLVLWMQSQTGYIIFLVDFLILSLFFIKKAPSIEKPIILFLIIIIILTPIPLIVKYVRDFGRYENVVHGESTGIRWLALISNYQSFRNYPMLGIGYGNSERRSNLFEVDDNIRTDTEEGATISLTSHNTPLRVAAELGLTGLIPFMLLVFHYYGSNRKNYKGFDEKKIIYTKNEMNLLGMVFKVLFINTLIYMLTQDTFTTLGMWIVFMTLSVWLKVKRNYEYRLSLIY